MTDATSLHSVDWSKIPPPVDDGGADHLPGLRLPDLELCSTSGTGVSLANLPGRSILFVYPWTGRPDVADPPNWDHIPGAHGSTPQAAAFRDLLPAFAGAGVRIFGLSAQSPDWQSEFAGRMRITYPLLSDEGLRFAEVLRLPRFETGGVTYLKRLTLICSDGVIERCIYPVHPPDRHAADLLRLLS